MVKWMVMAVVACAGLLAWRFSTSAKRNLPKVGEVAPGFELPDQHGKVRSLAGFKGKWLVLYFFPKADTPG